MSHSNFLAKYYLEMASEQRLDILNILDKEKLTPTAVAKKLSSTRSEVHRNFERLKNLGFIYKESSGDFLLTSFGQMALNLLPNYEFMISNKEYFKNHNFGDLPAKFVTRIGELNNSKHIKGFIRVLELWKSIYSNAEKLVYNHLYEVSYALDLLQTLGKKMQKQVEFQSIFAESPIVPVERKKILKQSGLDKIMKDDFVKRKMQKKIKVAVTLNEKEACVSFCGQDGIVDLTQAFYSSDPNFHEWCMDYFNYCWNKAGRFNESNLESKV